MKNASNQVMGLKVFVAIKCDTSMSILIQRGFILTEKNILTLYP